MGLLLDAIILKNLRQINEGIKLVTDATSRIEAAIAGIQGDIDGLKLAAQNLQDALDQALANQPQDVQDQINAAVQAARAEFDEQLDELATRLEELDNQTS
jgi:prefoldin subunit 5